MEISGGPASDCSSNVSCLYTEVYGDGSFSLGYFVKDIVQYDRVSGDLQTKSTNGSVIFGYVYVSVIVLCHKTCHVHKSFSLLISKNVDIYWFWFKHPMFSNLADQLGNHDCSICCYVLGEEFMHFWGI